MFTIECNTKYNSYPSIMLCCDMDSLFVIIVMLSGSNNIIQFKVSKGTTIYMSKDFGWNGYAKWVSRFAYD